MRIHIVQHVPFEPPGHLLSWANYSSDIVTFSRMHEAEWFPDPDLFDMLIVLGGPMSVQDTARYPWLVREMDFLEKTIKKRKKVLGICLGAQLIARVLNASIYKNPYPEIGWFPVRLAPVARTLPVFRKFPDSWTAFHWHAETFAIPPMCFRIAESDGCPNQGFLYEDHVMALQFHMETDAAGIESLLAHSTDHRETGSYIQSEEDIRKGIQAHLKTMHRMLENLLYAWFLEYPFPRN
jgi:GMP synthase-like glutamine amidotransferase